MSSSREAGYRGLIDLPAARLADIRQPRDRLRLLICESESAARQSLVEGLLGLNVEVACSDDGARALLDVGRLSPDVLLIAADLPPLGAPAVIKTVREISDRHIIVGAGPGQSDLVAAAIEAGADRLMERPYSIDQLRAVMLDFRSSVELDAVPLQVGPLKVDPLAYEVFLGDQIVPMPVRELEVLLYLIYHRDRVVTVRELQDALWATRQALAQLQLGRGRGQPPAVEICRTQCGHHQNREATRIPLPSSAARVRRFHPRRVWQVMGERSMIMSDRAGPGRGSCVRRWSPCSASCVRSARCLPTPVTLDVSASRTLINARSAACADTADVLRETIFGLALGQRSTPWRIPRLERQDMQLGGAAASIRRGALAGISWTAMVSAATSPLFRSMWTSRPPWSTKLVPAGYTCPVHLGSSLS